MRYAVLFLDDDNYILKAARRLFDEFDAEVITSDRPAEALSIIREKEIAVVVSDNLMPGMTGIEFLTEVSRISPDTVRILMTGYSDSLTAIDAINICGVFKFILKPWDYMELYRAVEQALSRYRLERSLKSSDEDMILSLAQAIELKDPLTKGHCDRVAVYSTLLSKCMDLDSATTRQVRYGSWLHDCGKIGVPESIINHPGQLLASEMAIVRMHPVWGAEMAVRANFSEIVVNIIHCHHEKYGGGGYPCSLKDEEIPLESRIVTVSDIFDALTSDRPYRRRYSLDSAVGVMREISGRVLDPRIVDNYLDVVVEEYLSGKESLDGDAEIVTAARE